MIKYDSIMNPERTLDHIKELLFSIYQKDYGASNREIIKKRWDNTIFILESNPVETRDFICQFRRYLHTTGLIQKQIEYLDYTQKEKTIDKEIKQEFKTFLEMKYNIFSEEQLDDLWNREEIVDNCSYRMASDIITLKEKLKQAKKIALITNTIWGRRLQKKYKELSVEQLAEIIFEEHFHASTCVAETKDGKKRTICYIPLIRYYNVPSLDRMVLHELRHVVETEEERSGLEVFTHPEFSMLNEMRTERNAKKDELKTPIIFSRKTTGIQSLYELILEKVEGFDCYEDFLNQVAFQGNIELAREELEPISNRIKEKEQEIQKKLKGMRMPIQTEKNMV